MRKVKIMKYGKFLESKSVNNFFANLTKNDRQLAIRYAKEHYWEMKGIGMSPKEAFKDATNKYKLNIKEQNILLSIIK